MYMMITFYLLQCKMILFDSYSLFHLLIVHFSTIYLLYAISSLLSRQFIYFHF